jgi:hypothetical protein
MAAPKVNEYLRVIAPKGEEALYMGYANIPFAVGWAFGSKIAGMVYDRTAAYTFWYGFAAVASPARSAWRSSSGS